MVRDECNWNHGQSVASTIRSETSVIKITLVTTMRYDEDLYVKVKHEASEWLFCNPSVNGVGIGPKIVAGKLTSEPAIQVYVYSKRPLHELSLAERIPHEIKGIKTDVIESAGFQETADCDNVFSRCLTGTVTEVTNTNQPIITSPSHGLAEADKVTIVGVEGILNRDWTIEVVDKDHFRLPEVDRRGNPVYNCNPGGATCATWFKVCEWTRPCCVPNGKITATTAANPVVVTTDSPHGLCTNDKVMIVDVEGMIELNFREFSIKTVAPDRFELKNIKGMSFTAYQRNGRWFKIGISPTGLIKDATRANPVRITSPNHGLADGDRVHIFGVVSMVELNTHNSEVPATIDTDGPDAFKLRGVDGRNFARPATANDGVWIRIREDQQKYRPIRGGIRIATHKETRTETPSQNPDEVNVHVSETFSFGTLGCIAKVNGTNQTVLLSNHHVLFATDDDTIYQPKHKSSKTNKIAERLTVQNAAAGTQQSPSTIDAAIAKIEDDIKAVPKIVDIGWVTGTAHVTLADICCAQGLNLQDPCDPANDGKCADEHKRIGYRVRKRGATTLLTEGIIISLCADFRERNTQVFLRNQMKIMSLAGGGRGVFNARGDSGSAVVNDKNEVVGLLVGNDRNGFGFASPIKDIEARLNIKVWAMPPATGTSPQVSEFEDDLQITPPTPELLAQVVQDLTQSETGKEFIALAQHHYQEIETLIHHNKRVMVVWRRNHGPAIVEEIHRVIEERNIQAPSFINGQPLMTCMENIISALKQFGSAKLVSDITRFAPGILRLGNISYSDFLESLYSPTSA
jgi:hypothetical protein